VRALTCSTSRARPPPPVPLRGPRGHAPLQSLDTVLTNREFSTALRRVYPAAPAELVLMPAIRHSPDGLRQPQPSLRLEKGFALLYIGFSRQVLPEGITTTEVAPRICTPIRGTVSAPDQFPNRTSSGFPSDIRPEPRSRPNTSVLYYLVRLPSLSILTLGCFVIPIGMTRQAAALRQPLRSPHIPWYN